MGQMWHSTRRAMRMRSEHTRPPRLSRDGGDGGTGRDQFAAGSGSMNRSRSTWLRLFAGVSALSGAALWFVLFIGPQWGFLGQGYRPNGIAAGAALVLVGLALLLG